MYIDRKSQFDNAIEYRGEITSFEKERELNDILNNLDKNQTTSIDNVTNSK
jgi:hypothetical protein